MLFEYNPLTDADMTYTLIQELFCESKLLHFETIEDFSEYEGWIIRDSNYQNIDIIKAVLLYTKIGEQYYIDFICSKVKGYGTRLLEHFLSKLDKTDIYLHVEISSNTSRLISWYNRYGFQEIENIFEPLLPEMIKYVITMKRTKLV